MSIELMPAAGLSEADVQRVAELFGRLVEAGAALGWVEAPLRAEIAELVADLASGVDDGETSAAIARTGDEIVGFAYWRRYARPTHRPHVDIEKVGVDPRAQGTGAGRGLMDALIASAREQGTEVVTLDLREDNAAAIGLYESLGFRLCGRLPRFVAVGAQRFDTLLYALDLRSGR
ncbi:GNAT family N-acetyltransferase [Brevibacterium spongiae]|uniref:GNAT family N-acetyltransferase n=1 Tax=Brevibacterium spongiae TaxID=2909672 RepID=A0ABY5SMN7_9MICO|nr:GNAT family N-acetyltransferase [Brevibacterium spongiae]UVI34473.1 GNAT family N-acetyltransferase [Brevibacterium spongiae]